MTFKHEHKLPSVPVCSSVPHFTEPLYFVLCQAGVAECAHRSMDYLTAISDGAVRLFIEQNQPYLDLLESAIELLEERERKPQYNHLSNDRTIYYTWANCSDLRGRAAKHIDMVFVIGFDSHRCNLSIRKRPLMAELFRADESNGSSHSFIVKNMDAITCEQF